MTIVRTERTFVEKITLADAPFFVELVNTPGWLRFIGDRNVGTVDESRQYLQGGILQAYADLGFSYYIAKTHDQQPIGICGFLKKPHLDNPDFGFAQLPEYGGQGLALEYSRAVFEYGIRTFGFAVLDAEVLPDNRRSINLLGKLGFQKLDFARDAEHDTDLYRWTAD